MSMGAIFFCVMDQDIRHLRENLKNKILLLIKRKYLSGLTGIGDTLLWLWISLGPVDCGNSRRDLEVTGGPQRMAI